MHLLQTCWRNLAWHSNSLPSEITTSSTSCCLEVSRTSKVHLLPEPYLQIKRKIHSASSSNIQILYILLHIYIPCMFSKCNYAVIWLEYNRQTYGTKSINWNVIQKKVFWKDWIFKMIHNGLPTISFKVEFEFVSR